MGDRLQRSIMTVCLILGCELLFLWPAQHQLVAGAVSGSSFFLAQLFFPHCRISVRRGVTPMNWMQAAFGFQLFVMPACVVLFGPSVFPLPSLPSTFAMNIAVLINTVAFWSFCCAAEYFGRRPVLTRAQIVVPRLPLAWCFLLLGIIGVILKFQSLETLTAYLTNPVVFITYKTSMTGTQPTVWQAASTFLLPFLGFGFVVLWCRSVDLGESGLQRAALLLLIGLSYILRDYNRGTLAVPFVAIVAVIGKRLRVHTLRYVVTAGIIALALVLALSIPKAGITAPDFDFMGVFQNYGQAPQQLAYFLEREHFGAEPTFGKTLGCSILDPVPVLGVPFRECSGTGIYNGFLVRTDQIALFSGELFLDFHIFGVIAGFALVGWLLAKLQGRFDVSHSAIEIYIIQFAAVWLGFLTAGSIDIISQVAIYFSAPIYLCLLTSRWHKRFVLRRATLRQHIEPLRYMSDR